MVQPRLITEVVEKSNQINQVIANSNCFRGLHSTRDYILAISRHRPQF